MCIYIVYLEVNKIDVAAMAIWHLEFKAMQETVFQQVGQKIFQRRLNGVDKLCSSTVFSVQSACLVFWFLQLRKQTGACEHILPFFSELLSILQLQFSISVSLVWKILSA